MELFWIVPFLFALALFYIGQYSNTVKNVWGGILLKFLLYILDFDSLETLFFLISILPLSYYCICLIGSTKGKLSCARIWEVVVGGQGNFAIWNIFLVCVMYHCAFGGLDA